MNSTVTANSSVVPKKTSSPTGMIRVSSTASPRRRVRISSSLVWARRARVLMTAARSVRARKISSRPAAPRRNSREQDVALGQPGGEGGHLGGGRVGQVGHVAARAYFADGRSEEL